MSSAWLVNSQAQPKVHGFPCPRWAALCIHTTGLSIPLPALTRDKDGSSGSLPPAHAQLRRQGQRVPKETSRPLVVWPLPALGPHLPPNALSPFPFPLSLTQPKLVPASWSLHSPFPLPVSFFPSPLAYFHLSVLSGLYLNVTSPEKFSLIIPGSHQSFPYDHPILLDIATAVATT